ncbi:phosphoenolpyruvate synthase regulatory protein [Phenylobacterium soli]|uniref:Putative pyruvate, phosphate dikinase regulatory protein n=1 Tax=Phenylobacterium soli TaxID=2170551 RepID=A0A328AR35_9CAUL|nr:phosphoenolpyruvate synthase regulatory protein [Phenylobacterium soli]
MNPGRAGPLTLRDLSPIAPGFAKRGSTGLVPRYFDQDPVAALPNAAAPPPRLATYFHVHLVSDSTGETLNAMARAVCARFDNVLPIEHIYALVRSQRQLDRALGDIEEAPGVVIHTIVDEKLRHALEEGCRRMDMPCIPALDPLVSALSRYLGASTTTRVGAHLRLDTDYFNRMDALNYAIGHDDGQGGQDLDRADVVLLGVSRTSKTPTCIYLAHRGVRAANVPLVPGRPLPDRLFHLNNALVVGLTISPDRLIQIRRNRLLSLKEERESAYIDVDAVRDEIVQARRLYERHSWPVIDVTRRSVEETAAAILNLLHGGHGQVEVLG